MKSPVKTAVVRARIEPKIKVQAERVLHALGLSSSEAINVFYKRIVSEKGIPFSLHVPNAETKSVIKSARRGIDTESFDSVAEWERQLGV